MLFLIIVVQYKKNSLCSGFISVKGYMDDDTLKKEIDYILKIV